MTVIIGGGGGAGKPTNPNLLSHVPLWFTNRQIMMMAKRTVRYNAPFEGALMGSSTAQYPPFELLGKPLPLEFLDSSLRTRHESRGAIVQPCDIQTHLGLRIQPNNMAHSVPKPKPQAAFRPIEWMIFINSYYATSSESHLVICFPNKKVIARPYYLSVARQCRGASLPSMSTEVGTISKAILTTPHSHLNIHLQLTILDLPLH